MSTESISSSTHIYSLYWRHIHSTEKHMINKILHKIQILLKLSFSLFLKFNE